MRFANPPKIASYLINRVNYGNLGGQGVEESTFNDLSSMNTIGEAYQTGLALEAQDRAADLRRAAGAYANDQAVGAANFAGIMGAIGTVGGSAINAGVNQTGIFTPKTEPSIMDFNKYKSAFSSDYALGGLTPSEIFSQRINYNPFSR